MIGLTATNGDHIGGGEEHGRSGNPSGKLLSLCEPQRTGHFRSAVMHDYGRYGRAVHHAATAESLELDRSK
jgi:hypothetical protein